MSKIYVGISGWTFEGWRGNFYPEGLKQKDELANASRRVYSIEVNGSFYSLFKPSTYQNWYEQTPADFTFALKAPKFITHERRLKDFATPLSNFLASGILALGEKLGPILWQFPPSMPFTPERFEPFLAALPHDMETAAKLGEGHSSWLEGNTYLSVPKNHVMRHAIEGRHESFLSPVFVELARRYGVAIVVGDTAGRWPYIEDVTTDFIYLRLHGDETKYPEGYTKEAIEHFAKRFHSWSEGGQPEDAALVVPGAPPNMSRQVFAYFDNDVKETAPLSALSMISHLSQLGLLQERHIEELAAPPSTPKKRAKPAAPKKQTKSAKAATSPSSTPKTKSTRKRPLRSA